MRKNAGKLLKILPRECGRPESVIIFQRLHQVITKVAQRLLVVG